MPRILSTTGRALAATALILSLAAPSLAGDIQANGQLISTVATGTPPLAVSSTDLVDNLNADQLDGLEGADLALAADLTAAVAALELQIDDLQAQIDALVGGARVEVTGQTMCWDEVGSPIACAGTGQDGDLQAGVVWPDPRFTDQADGTVLDNLTGLVWLQDASCSDLDGTDIDGLGDWNVALSASNALASGTCGLTDGSLAGDWRLPNVKELQSLIDYGAMLPALESPNPFTDVELSEAYWSSTTDEGKLFGAWIVNFNDGSVAVDGKTPFGFFIWPVRNP